MLTGIETAGLVLGILPLFISAFEHYNDGLEPIKAFWDIDRLLPIQIRRLRNQHVHYEQTLRILLAQIVDRNEVEEMIAAPNSDIWKTPDMQERLELMLQESYNAYQDTISHMEDIMKKIAKGFKVDHSERANRTNLEALLRTNTRADGAFEFKRRVKFAMSGKKMKTLLDDLDECNKELERFTDKSERLAPYRKTPTKPIANPLNPVRTYAKALYNVLCVGASCRGFHKAKLGLEKRTKPPKGSRSLMSKDGDDICFTISFLVSQDPANPASLRIWQETRIQILTDDLAANPPPRPPPAPGHRSVGFNLPPPVPLRRPVGAPVIDLRRLPNLRDVCSALRQSQVTNPCVGFCIDAEGQLRGVYPVETRRQPVSDIITLQDILTASTLPTPTLLRMSRKERMNLAVVLASSYLQLQSTPWLQDAWGKKDIVFDINRNTLSARPCNVEQPYFAHNFRPLAAQNIGAQGQIGLGVMPLSPGNSSLLSLGIVLLELYTGQTFEQFCSELSLASGSSLDAYMQQLRNLDILSRWLNAKQEDLSAGYHGAVLHCIRRFLDPIQNLNDEAAFRQSIYDQVIVPLQEELQSFLGESRRGG